jgi:XTP/dITP diphosphohydrolase
VREDQPTFEANARKKAEVYSRFAPEAIVLADDSGLEVRALGGAPGVRSARYAATSPEENASDAANNARLLAELQAVPEDQRQARFVCVIVAACDGQALASFRGEAQGTILHAPCGSGGFGYDPLFYFPALGKTFAELPASEKARVSHRGQAFRKFLEWMDRQESGVGSQ